MTLEQEMILQLLKRVLTADPKFTHEIKSSRENLFFIVASVYVLDEYCKEFSFLKEQMDEIFSALLKNEQKKTTTLFSSDRSRIFYNKVMRSALLLKQQEDFRRSVTIAVLEAVKKKSK
jgi:hypothetical protein